MPFPLLLQRAVNRLGHPLGINPFPRSFDNPIARTHNDPSQIFDEIYHRNYWASPESRSGVGSEAAFTARYSSGLQALLKRRHIQSLFDAPCGDLNWMSDVIAESQVHYIGADIAASVVEAARASYSGLDLRVFDISQDPFPDVDLWHCRDCLFHLPFQLIHQALANFCRSTIPYALITTHRSRLLHQNLDVSTGGFRLLDLEKPPISLPPPLERIRDYRPGRDFPRYVCLWSREQISAALNQ